MSAAQGSKANESSIVALDKFIQATRDSGYKSTASAMSELVDNSIQAGATQIAISIKASAAAESENGIDVSVVDNGCGMDPFTLRQALRFGGSTRFGDRSGLGRYGMGLPNASLSQARRVTVFTWQSIGTQDTTSVLRSRGDRRRERVCMSYLDVDEIVQCKMIDVPRPEILRNPPAQCRGRSGTLVLWTHCDRLDNRRISTIVGKLGAELGRRFRHFLWKGVRITINGDAVRPFDPLYLQSDADVSGARVFGDELRYEIAVDVSNPAVTGTVRVRFSELPVNEWHKLSNEEKRRIGLSKGAGISIVRAGREVDYGWFFMGTKHRENYDDWWRCEIQFDPVLDEAFGIAHTKQHVRPQAHLIEALTSDLEATARALNSRARKAYLGVKAKERFSEAERVASRCDRVLPPLPTRANAQSRITMRGLERSYPALRRASNQGESRYRIVEGAVKDANFFTFAYDGKRLVVVLNVEHPFYREIYKPLVEADNPRDQQLRAKIELFVLSAARSEAGAKGQAATLNKHRIEWSNTLAAFLNAK